MKTQIRAVLGGNRHQCIAFYVDCEDGSQVFTAKPVEFEKCELYAADSEPYLQIPKANAQVLMDDLWDCGLRPSEGSGSAGQLAATQRHLEDCRKLLSKVPLVKEVA
jgi:hypothetical protein